MRSASLFCGAIAAILLLVGQGSVAGGMMLGFLLFVGNGILMVEAGRTLLGRGGSRARIAVAGSSFGRLLLLGLLLAGIFHFLGRSAGMGACGGLLVSQVNLHLPIRRTGVAT
jgi:hypothetical protein